MPLSLILLLVAVAFFTLPTAVVVILAAYVLISSASLATVAGFVVGKVSLTDAIKANLNASVVGVLTIVLLLFMMSGKNPFFAGVFGLVVGSLAALFIYAHYLQTTVPKALLVFVLAGLVTTGCMWVIAGFLGMGQALQGYLQA